MCMCTCVCGDNHPVACSSFYFDDVGFVVFLFGRLISCQWAWTPSSFHISKHEMLYATAASTQITYWDLHHPYTRHLWYFFSSKRRKSLFVEWMKEKKTLLFTVAWLHLPYCCLLFFCLPTTNFRMINLNLMQIVHNCSTISSTWTRQIRNFVGNKYAWNNDTLKRSIAMWIGKRDT